MSMQLHGRFGQVHPKWFTTAFWVILVVSTYWLVFNSDWQWWFLLAAFGGAANYCWWRVRRPQKLRALWALACGLIATAALLSAGWALLTPFSVSNESVGNNRVVCGSIVNRVPGDDPRETDGTSGELIVRERPIPQREFVRVCANNSDYRTSDVVGATVTGLLFTFRATGHLVRRADSTTDEATQSFRS
ncbi:hypothetical protein BH93_09315 [Rhodococcoides fascians A25f]|uniref:hypothetical protein n=1 Tax=Rhodococcoides fascians TaxID=1828 RepID=UPI000565902A|nr:hypothetical protein [Rhodococcus fascians]QII05545.1 hypothetical protein BH93_09315 [Rhodococcus fascians A25f]